MGLRAAQLVVPIMNEFKEIETCLECSAKSLIFVGEVFFYALKAVVHPTRPLFNSQCQQLKPLCVAALKRIFMMCDKDKVRTFLHGGTPLQLPPVQLRIRLEGNWKWCAVQGMK